VQIAYFFSGHFFCHIPPLVYFRDSLGYCGSRYNSEYDMKRSGVCLAKNGT